MPTTNVYDDFIVAGKEVSSTYEGRHLTLEESILVHPSHTDGFVDKGDPVISGFTVGVAFNGAEAATDMVAIDTEGIWALTVQGVGPLGNLGIAIGDPVYINRTTAVLSANSDRESNAPFGIALNEVVSGATTTVIAVKVHNDFSLAQVDESYIVVSKGGNDTYGDGSFSNPYLTITKAFTMVTAARNTVYVFPGEYAEAAILTWPLIENVNLIGLDGSGSVAISNANAAAAVLNIHPTVVDIGEVFIQNVDIVAVNQNGIMMDNEHLTEKLLVHLINVDFEQEGTGDSLHVDHANSADAIRIYAKAEEADVEGPVNITTNNAGDRFRFKGYNFTTTFTTSADSVASEITLKDCGLLSAASLVGGDGAQKLNLIGCWLFDGTTYAVTGAVNSTHANVNLQLT